MPEAISDSSILIHTARIGRLDILKAFYEKILITPAVWKEVVEEGENRSGALEVKEASSSGWVNDPGLRCDSSPGHLVRAWFY